MNNKKSTKRALISSILSLMLCMTMLIGTTFAWFTDSVTSANNKIQAGNLDVDLYLWTSETASTEITDESDPIFGAGSLAQNNNASTLWEPGKTQVAYLSIKNNGTLDLKYKVAINVDAQESNLYEVMKYAITPNATYGDVTSWNANDGVAVTPGVNATSSNDVALMAGQEHFFALSIHMDEEAGNAYQDGKVAFDIKVLAGQLASEEDSFGSDYDTFAAYPGTGFAPVPTGNETAAEVVAKNEDNVALGSAVIPKEAVDASASQLNLIIDESAYVANISVDTGSETKAFDVKIEGLKEGNTTPVKITLNLPKNLDPATVELYHYDQWIPSTYDPNSGYVTFESATFSPFTVVYDAESVYVPTPPAEDKSDLPEATVVESPEYVGVDLPWGSYGAWSPTEGLDSKLEAAYTFSCAETLEEAKANPYANWYCDFYVVLNKDLGANEIFLGGNYGSFGWVGFHNGDLTLEANTEIPLLGSVTSNPWTYLDVVQNVGTFICGVGDVDDALTGAEFTVMLRLTNPNDKTDFINVATIKHTFVQDAQ